MTSALIEAVLSHTDRHAPAGHFYQTDIAGLLLMRTDGTTVPHYTIYKPVLCINVQGAKTAMVGDEVLSYAQGQFLVVSVDLPILGGVTQASPDKPYLAMILEIDMPLLRAVIDQIGAASGAAEPGLGVFIGDFEGPLQDCALRMIALLQTPKAIPVLYPAIARELYYWLLTGPHGATIARLALPDSHAQRIARAIHAMRADFRRPLRVEQLAAIANMSASSFHQHFKTVTSMTPLQFQKNLRLLEARRVMMSDAVNATTAAYRVGYESVSQFSRDYARMFGAPPRRDLAQLRMSAA